MCELFRLLISEGDGLFLSCSATVVNPFSFCDTFNLEVTVVEKNVGHVVV